jgi:hypothetical protein
LRLLRSSRDFCWRSHPASGPPVKGLAAPAGDGPLVLAPSSLYVDTRHGYELIRKGLGKIGFAGKKYGPGDCSAAAKSDFPTTNSGRHGLNNIVVVPAQFTLQDSAVAPKITRQGR